MAHKSARLSSIRAHARERRGLGACHEPGQAGSCLPCPPRAQPQVLPEAGPIPAPACFVCLARLGPDPRLLPEARAHPRPGLFCLPCPPRPSPGSCRRRGPIPAPGRLLAVLAGFQAGSSLGDGAGSPERLAPGQPETLESAGRSEGFGLGHAHTAPADEVLDPVVGAAGGDALGQFGADRPYIGNPEPHRRPGAPPSAPAGPRTEICAGVHVRPAHLDTVAASVQHQALGGPEPHRLAVEQAGQKRPPGNGV